AASRPYAAAALALARTLRQRGIARVVGYGTGDVARAFIDAARIMGVDVAGLVDSNRSQHGLCLYGVDVISLDAAVALGVDVYVASWLPAHLENTVCHLDSADARVRGVGTHSARITETLEGDTVTILGSQAYTPGLKAITLMGMARSNNIPPIAFLYRRATL